MNATQELLNELDEATIAVIAELRRVRDLNSELLAALKELLEWAEAETPDDLPREVLSARAAIAKAEAGR